MTPSKSDEGGASRVPDPNKAVQPAPSQRSSNEDSSSTLLLADVSSQYEKIGIVAPTFPPEAPKGAGANTPTLHDHADAPMPYAQQRPSLNSQPSDASASMVENEKKVCKGELGLVCSKQHQLPMFLSSKSFFALAPYYVLFMFHANPSSIRYTMAVYPPS